MTSVELTIDGMTCASCAHRIETKLSKLDGVTATVNFATERARVEYGDAVTHEQLVARRPATRRIYPRRLPPLTRILATCLGKGC
jgi:copper chaperone CopZ